jgi:hypothetical protein
MKERNRSRRQISAVAFLFLGLIGVWGMGDSAFANYRPVDLVRLLAAGACFGVALVLTVEYLRGRRPGGA